MNWLKRFIRWCFRGALFKRGPFSIYLSPLKWMVGFEIGLAYFSVRLGPIRIALLSWTVQEVLSEWLDD